MTTTTPAPIEVPNQAVHRPEADNMTTVASRAPDRTLSIKTQVAKGLVAMCVAALCSTILFALPASAHNDPYTGQPPTIAGIAGTEWSASKGRVTVMVSDIKTDGHCVVGRVHKNGWWQQVSKDCSNNGIQNGVIGSIGGIRSGSWVWTSICISGHYGSSTCSYHQVKVK